MQRPVLVRVSNVVKSRRKDLKMQANATAIEGASPALPEPGVSKAAIVIVTFNQSHFLGDAIASALGSDTTRR